MKDYVNTVVNTEVKREKRNVIEILALGHGNKSVDNLKRTNNTNEI